MSAPWSPIESDPAILNQLMEKVGVTAVKFVDVYSFDDEKMLKLLPQPQLAVILSIPTYEKYEEMMKPVYEKLTDENVKELFFVKQAIPNSSGSLAVFHCLANLQDKIDLGTGALRDWLDSVKGMSPDERNKTLSEDAALVIAHDETAKIGATHVPAQVHHHFVAFVCKDGILYEIDSRAPFPRVVSSTSEKTLIADVGKEAKELMTQMGSASFSAVALVPI